MNVVAGCISARINSTNPKIVKSSGLALVNLLRIGEATSVLGRYDEAGAALLAVQAEYAGLPPPGVKSSTWEAGRDATEAALRDLYDVSGREPSGPR